MRYLNKIIFLNSAHIPYAEVKLDGNVHFIGTQGVGKSTLLRALLFFYNADKLKLGIPKEKKGFDAFYFMYANSYIVYEVMRENGAYCVVATKSQGRVFFRFVDAPYASEWFIGERNEVYSEWGRIREKMGAKCHVTPKVEKYETYRDIIFGNNKKLDVQYRKFAIVENTQYQNIPRTIQNVFLNSKLEADFIKDTIIRSMNDEDLFIDLDFYRGQTKAFEQEYTDVMRWFEKNKNGEVPVRKMAQKVMDMYRDLIYTRRHIDGLRGELNFSEKRTLQEIPLVREEINKSSVERERLVRLVGELQQKYAKEHDGLVSEIGILGDYLKTIRQKQQDYERLQIGGVIERVEREDLQLQELEHTRDLKAELTKAYEDVMAKYRSLQDKIETDFRFYENQQNARKVDKQLAMNKQSETIMNECHLNEEKVRLGFEEKLRIADTKMTQIREERADCEKEYVKLPYTHLHEKEMTDCEESMNRIKEREKELEIQIRQQHQQCNQLRQECELARKELEYTYQGKRDVIQKKKKELSEKVQALSSLSDKWKGSFGEWLEVNKPDWRENIGQVVDEESVLYADGLFPELVENSATLFGISLNLEALDRSVRSPEDSRRELEMYALTLQEVNGQLTELSEEQLVAVESLEKKYNKRIREITNDIHLQEAEKNQVPVLLRNQQADYVTWKTKDEAWRKEQTVKYQHRMSEIAHRLMQAEEEKSKLQHERNKQLTACQKVYKEARSAIQTELSQFANRIQTEINDYRTKVEGRKQALMSEREAELSGKNVNTVLIRQYETVIDKIQQELQYIKVHRRLVTDFERDKKELFDREDEFRQEKKKLERKQEDLDNKYLLRKEKLAAQQADTEKLLAGNRKELGNLEEGLKKAEAFRQDDTFCSSDLIEVKEVPTRKSCGFIVDELKAQIFADFKKEDEMKKAINLFKSNFSSKNTFNFRIDLMSANDYMDFASGLCEFVDNDKISDYQKHISERYTDIIRRISKEVGDLTRNESEIIKTIGAINDDFLENIFAGVIREIALRPLQSSDKLMQLLLEIKQFNDENQQNMGVVDLFSQASREDVNATAVRYLSAFMKLLLDDVSRNKLSLSDAFKLEFRVKENDNDTDWVEKIANVGSDGTDILVKAMVNIMLINVFKEKASRKFGDFKIHCMMDEIGKLHPNNVKGILDFANCRNILLVNSSPTTYNVADYRYTYLLSKDGHSNTLVVPLLTKKEANL